MSYFIRLLHHWVEMRISTREETVHYSSNRR